MGIHLFKSKKLLDVLEYGIEAPVKIALQLENFYILPSREKAPYCIVYSTHVNICIYHVILLKIKIPLCCYASMLVATDKTERGDATYFSWFKQVWFSNNTKQQHNR